MFSLRTSFGCLLLIVAASHLPAADAPPAKDKEKEKVAPAERTVSTGQVVGTIGNFNESDGKFTVNIKMRYVEANQQAQQNYARDLQNLMVRQQNLMRNKNPVQRQQELAKILQDAQKLQGNQQNFYQVKEKDQNVELELIDDAKVRLAAPPAHFDDKGNIKAYTAEELKALKGTGEDAKLPGYPTERDSLRNGQTVLITLGHKVGGEKKNLDADEKKPDADEKKPDAGAKKLPPAPTRPKVIMVMILAEPKG